MIKDLLLKAIFIPVLGISLPIIAGIVSYERQSPVQIILVGAFFIVTSFLIWMGCTWIHRKLRPLYRPISNPLSKILTVCVVSALYAACTGSLSVIAWQKISNENFPEAGMYRFVAACIAAAILFTLLYEILFLRKEKELDTKIVDQLDKERSLAELQALTNEMDPHFLFNSLNALNHLIVNEPSLAHAFNNKLAQVYKYFLINKNKELIPLRDELEFIENYVYLLRIRHDDKLHLHTILSSQTQQVMIPPCSLQVLVENAIKHNEFTEEIPLHIKVSANENFLYVSNNFKPKSYAVNSTGIGLKNLNARYRILFRKDIRIERTRENFTVKLPLIT
jgi:hypothetical protein